MILLKGLDDPRRRLLVQALALGMLGAAAPMPAAYAQLFGNRPRRLPPGQSIYKIEGEARVNGEVATLDTKIAPRDTVETGRNSELIFVVGGNSMIMRADSRMVMEPSPAPTENALITGLRLLTGKVLSVSRNNAMKFTTTTATIGIRGTGLYLEADPEQTYFCLCYGTADVAALNDPASTDSVTAQRHDKPLYIAAKAPEGNSIRRAPFINHTDQELALIETLVGRTTPFVFPSGLYSGPRRDY
jgi:hypothetical protein